MAKKEATSSVERILSALGLDAGNARIVKGIMREDVFHSTLDWQSSEQLLGGAIKAHDLFRRDEAFYRADYRSRLARFHLTRLEANFNPDAEGGAAALRDARLEVAAAEASLERHCNSSL